MSIRIPRSFVALMAAIGSLGLAGAALGAAAPAPASATPVNVNPKVFTWAVVPPETVGGTVTYEYCPTLAACITGTATDGLTATIVAPQGASTFFVRSVETPLVGPQIVSAFATLAVATDTVAPLEPTVTADRPLTGILYGGPTFTITSEAGATIAWRVTRDGAPWDSGAGGTAVVSPGRTGQAGSDFVFSATATDAAGNVSPATTRTFTVDTVPPTDPTFAPGDPASGAILKAIPTYDLGGGSEPVTYEWRVGTSGDFSVAAGSGLVNLAAFPRLFPSDGLYTFQARAKDLTGFNASGVVTRTFTLDRLAPNAPTITPDISDITNTPPNVTLGGAGEPATYRWTIDGGSVNVGATANLVGLADGNHTFQAWAVDTAGNIGMKTTRNFKLDRNAPDPPTVTKPAPFVNRVPKITATGAAGTTILWTLTGPRNANGEGSSPLTPNLGTLPDGDYTFSATARTAAGNRSGSTKVGFTMDTVAPDAPVVTSGPGSDRSGPKPKFTWRGEAGASFAWRVQQGELVVAGPVTTNTAGTQMSPLLPARYVFKVVQVDQAGNASASSGDYPFTIRGRIPAGAVVQGLFKKRRLLVTPFGPLRPRPGRITASQQPFKIVWVYKSGRPSRLFNVQVFDEKGKKRGSFFTKRTTFTIPRKFQRGGKRGVRYYWQVWPYWDKRGYARRPLGVSYYDVRPKRVTTIAPPPPKG